MSATLEPEPKDPPRRALELCAEDLGIASADVRILSGTPGGVSFKSRIFYIGAKGSDEPLYVVKMDAGAYDPEHEQRALGYAANALGRSPASGVNRLGVVRPLGCGTNPNFLVTHHQSGELANERIDEFVLRGADPVRTTDAHAAATLMARWIGAFRSAGVEPRGGLDPVAYLEELRRRAATLGRGLGSARRLDRVVGNLERDLDQLGAEDLERMRRRYPNRGDARPKNFLVGPDGVLYALDMEGFGFGPMEHDISCLHHALEYDGWRLPAAARRAEKLWETIWDEYMQHGSSPPFVMLGYVYFLLERMHKTIELDAGASWKRKARTRVWLRNRLAWLARLNGNLAEDAEHMRRNL